MITKSCSLRTNLGAQIAGQSVSQAEKESDVCQVPIEHVVASIRPTGCCIGELLRHFRAYRPKCCLLMHCASKHAP